MATVLERSLYPLFRRVDFRGKGRLRRVLPVPASGERVVAFRGGLRLKLDLRESLQRDYLFGLYDDRELAFVRSRLAEGGDFVDVGAHVGLYALTAAHALGEGGRVLAFEPNPDARAQLDENVRLNGCGNVLVTAHAAAEAPGRAMLHVPSSRDPSFSSLEAGRFREATPVPVDTTTVDAEVEEHGLRPALVKIDVEGAELRVVSGMERTLEALPALLVEIGPATASELEGRLAPRGYRAYRFGRRGLEPGIEGVPGVFNAVFVART